MITFFAFILIVGLSLLVSLTFILKSIHLQSYRDIYPENITQLFLNPESEYFKERTPKCLYFTKSMNYTIALEHNHQINDKKAKFLTIASIFVFISVILISILLILVSNF